MKPKRIYRMIGLVGGIIAYLASSYIIWSELRIMKSNADVVLTRLPDMEDSTLRERAIERIQRQENEVPMQIHIIELYLVVMFTTLLGLGSGLYLLGKSDRKNEVNSPDVG